MFKRYVSVVLALTLLFSLLGICVPATAATEPDSVKVYENNFDTPIPFALSAVEHGQTVNGFQRDTENDTYIASSGSGFYDGTLTNGEEATSLTDYTVTLKVKGRNQNFAILVRAASYNNFYAIGFSGTANQLRILKRTQTQNGVGDWAVNSTGSDSFQVLSSVNIDVSKWTELKVTCIGNTISLYVDTVLAATFTDSAYASGSFGIRSYQGDLQIDDLTVQSTQGDVLLAEDFSEPKAVSPLEGFSAGVENGMGNQFTVQNGALTGSGHIFYNGTLLQNTPATALRSYTLSFRFKGSSSFFTTVHAAPNRDYQTAGGNVDPYYFYAIGLNNGQGRVLKRYNNSWPINTTETKVVAGDSLTCSAVTVDPSIWNTAEITVSEYSITFKVNGTTAVVIDTQNSDLKLDHGSFGFRSSDNALMIDDLAVYAPDTELSSGDQLINAYVSHKSESASTHAIRFVMVTPLEALKNYEAEALKVQIRFTCQDGDEIFTGYLGTTPGGEHSFTLYDSVTASEKSYRAMYGYAIFGCVVTNIPENAWESVSLTVINTSDQAVIYTSNTLTYQEIVTE